MFTFRVKKKKKERTDSKGGLYHECKHFSKKGYTEIQTNRARLVAKPCNKIQRNAPHLDSLKCCTIPLLTKKQATQTVERKKKKKEEDRQATSWGNFRLSEKTGHSLSILFEVYRQHHTISTSFFCFLFYNIEKKENSFKLIFTEWKSVSLMVQCLTWKETTASDSIMWCEAWQPSHSHT